MIAHVESKELIFTIYNSLTWEFITFYSSMWEYITSSLFNLSCLWAVQSYTDIKPYQFKKKQNVEEIFFLPYKVL